ncbi:hypothetical protein BKI52_20335 [marine bacterium AO1-C]|nr:hypothetical protein BKI52_20335 [marine bacterium AO1-C]
MKIFNKIKWVAFLMVIGLYSCNQQDQNVAPTTSVVPITKPAEISTELDRQRADFAKALAKSLANSQVREFVKNEAAKKFDGDFDILYGKVRNTQVGGQTFEQAIMENFVSANGRVNKTQFVDDLLNQDPRLNVAVPVNIKGWNTANYAPMVAVLTSTYKERETSHVLAYDSEGNEHWIDAQNAPDVPVVVVGWNERLKSRAQFERKMDLMYSIGECQEILRLKTSTPAYYNSPDGTKPLYFVIEDPCGGSGGGSTGGGSTGGGSNGSGVGTANGGDSTACGTEVERINEMYFTKNGIKVYEGWLSGAPEIDVKVYSAVIGFTQANLVRFFDQLKPDKRSDIIDQWWNVGGISVVNWDENVFGPALHFFFIEYDYVPFEVTFTDTREFSVQIPELAEASRSFEFEYEFTTGDVEMGGYTVLKCNEFPDFIGGKKCFALNQNFFFRLGE